MNSVRVDRVDERRVPVGMNSILYIGDSMKGAMKVYRDASVGLDTWNQPNASYGVAISTWNDRVNDYVVLEAKGLPEE